MTTRRTVLAAGALGGGLAALGATGVQSDVLPGRVAVWTAAGGVLLPDRTPSAAPGPIDRLALRSEHRRGVTGVLVMTPPGYDPTVADLPVCVVLHGRGGDAGSAEGLRVPGFLADAVAAGVPPFAAVAVDGGEAYWHARADGTDPLRLVTDDVLPLLAGRGLRCGPADPLAVLGWSMGGYGALLLAERLGGQVGGQTGGQSGGQSGGRRCAGVAALSPALWSRFEDARPGAFDDAADFARNDVFAGRHRLAGVAVRVDCSLGEVFLPTVRRFVDGLDPRPAGGFGPGVHDGRYWRRRMPDALAHVGRALAAAADG